MKKKIIFVPHEVLRKKSRAFDLQTEEKLAKNYIASLKDTLAPNNRSIGVGLAAPQIGKNLRIFSLFLPDELNREDSDWDMLSDMKDPGRFRAFVNPTITKTLGKHTLGPNPDEPMIEGCLSIPGLWSPVPRFNTITVKYWELSSAGKLEEKEENFSGLYSRIIQHEYDHLEGVLFTDYALEYKLPIYRRSRDEYIEIDPEIAKTF